MVFWKLDYTLALLGGLTIGLSVTILLLFKGRVTGISGILYGIMAPKEKAWHWRLSFLAGLLFGGLVLLLVYPSTFIITTHRETLHLIIAGLLVGYGTLLGNGCTSGHGVCGISRLSARSLVATLTFVISGMIATFVMGLLLGGLQ